MMVFVMIIFATATTLYMGRGAILVSFIVCYSVTSLVAGFTSGSLYSRNNGRVWIPTMIYSVTKHSIHLRCLHALDQH